MFDEREADDVELYGGVHIIECFPADDAKEIVDRAPTVDAVEVVHGRWIHRPDERRCPFCGYHYSYFGGKDYNYCPNCGAQMDGDNNGPN